MNELQHHGVKGMKWGVRKKNPYIARNVRRHAGPGVRVGSTERKLAGAKQDLARLDRGEHLSVGSTKKRQAQYDARDRKALKEKIAKLEAEKTNPESARTRRLNSAVERQKAVVESWKDASAITDKKGRTIYSKREVEEIYSAAQDRLKKLEYKQIISQKRDQINAGASVVERIWNKLTDADKYQAEIEYDIEKRAKANKAWRD